MKITWLGHDAFLFETNNTNIISDPYIAGSFDGAVGYKPIEERADIAMVSHDHPDHGGYEELPGNPEVVMGTGEFEVKDIRFTGIDTFHDKTEGSERGPNTVFVFETEDMKICHLGDLGHTLTPEKIAKIGKIDILFVPVGGFFTIDHTEAWEVVENLSPGIVFPMHYKTDVLDFPLDPVDTFLEGKSNVTMIDGSTVELDSKYLSGEMKIMVFQQHKY